jgi:hypothetical protein
MTKVGNKVIYSRVLLQNPQVKKSRTIYIPISVSNVRIACIINNFRGSFLFVVQERIYFVLSVFLKYPCTRFLSLHKIMYKVVQI